jgi:hypothetical protein
MLTRVVVIVATIVGALAVRSATAATVEPACAPHGPCTPAAVLVDQRR